MNGGVRGVALGLAVVALACTTKPVTDSRPPPDGTQSQDQTGDVTGTTGAEAPVHAARELGALNIVACSKIVKTRVTQIPAAPFVSQDAHMAWTGDGVLVWSGRRDKAAVYSPSRRRWSSLDATFTGMLIRGVSGPQLVATPDGQYPHPLSGVLVDAGAGKTRPFAAPTKVMLEPLTVGEWLLFSGDSRAPISSDNPVVFDARRNKWTTVSGPMPADFARRTDRADTFGDGFLFRWGGAFGSTAHADGSLIDMRAATRVEIPSNGAPSARIHARAASEGRRVAVWGGYAVDPAQPGRRTMLDDGGIYELDSQTWRPIPALEDAPWTSQRGAELTERALVVWGDRNNTPLLATFDLERERWSIVELPGGGTQHYVGVVHQVDAGLLLFIGRSNYAILDSTDPAQQRWCEAPLPDGADKRGNLRSAWTGDALVLWGGMTAGRSGGCENHTGPEGCDPYVEHIHMADGWLIELRKR
jgi:hypothetical protein